ncbi:NADPH-dependent FMN reductase [Myroides pelagicus]|uniref:NADPH-dependent FMN reductase n=1 Tax=Myroides pelagicus TaxID=270914 RepID=A0A7K1GN22_9FLAO|nr:NADPH-dependent FMN reductase [Myroides pelagicus]MEC4113385.1 NADPH-dependent FMN reductase [Myroides pelagicus]MTH30277.1 NADPH-dependent FMN reductase [Myroides pelagicus]
MKITAFAASNSSTSINGQLVELATKYFPNDQINLLDLNDFEMPIYSEDRNKQGVPSQATAFNQAISESDALIISLAEHNGSFTTAFKNIFDWASREDMKVFKDKPMLLLSTSPGARGASGVLQQAQSIFPYFGGNIIASYSLGQFYDNFKDAEIINPEQKALLTQTIQNFKDHL